MEYLLRPRTYAAITPENGVAGVLTEDARRCVVFLGSTIGFSDDANVAPTGTGFLLSGGNLLGDGTYLVTARHVAEKLVAPFAVRLNAQGGKARIHEIERREHIRWYVHPDKSVDLAVAPFTPPDWADIKPFCADHALTKTKLKSKGIGVGDQAYVVGLFHLLGQQSRNEPVVHTGTLALMGDGVTIPVKDVGNVEAHLVQTNALSGSSGSPVFVSRTIGVKVQDPEGNKLSAWVQGTIWLLGVWQSSWKVDKDRIVTAEDARDKFLAPLGMGAVVPFPKLLDILRQDDLKELRAAGASKVRGAVSMTPDALAPATTDNPSHKEDFMRLVGAAAKSRKRDDQT